MRRSSSPAPRASAGQLIRAAGVPGRYGRSPSTSVAASASSDAGPVGTSRRWPESRRSHRSRSVRGSTSSDCEPAILAGVQADEGDRVGERQRRRIEAPTAPTRKARDHAHLAGPPRGARGERPRQPDRPPGERVDHLAAGEPEHAAPDHDPGLERLVLDDPLGVQAAAHPGSPCGEPDPRGHDRGERHERDAGHEQPGGVEHEPDEDQSRPPERDPRRATHNALTDEIASATTSRAVARDEPGASTSRWARTGSASAWTSSGSAWSRPLHHRVRLRRAQEHQTGAWAGAEVDARVLARAPQQPDHVVAERLGGAHPRGRVLGGQQLATVGHRPRATCTRSPAS